MHRLATDTQEAPTALATARGDDSIIWDRIGERIEANLGAIEHHAHLLLDRALTGREVESATAAAATLARQAGEMELPAIAQLGRHIESTLETDDLSAIHAVQIAGTSEDIRSLFRSAVAQQESRAQTRGTIAMVGTPTHDVDRISWILGTRGHGVVHHTDQITPGTGDLAGVILAFPDGFTAATEALLRVIGETWSVPTIALYDAPDPAALRTLATTCSSVLPLTASAELIGSELDRIEAVGTAEPVVCAFGRVPRAAQQRLRAHGFRIRRAREIDDLPTMLHEGHAAVVFGQTIAATDVISIARVIRAMPAIRRSLLLWLSDEPGYSRELADRLGILVVDSITDAVAAHTSAVVRRDSAMHAEADPAAASVVDWTAARVLTDRAIVAAYRAGETLAVAVMDIAADIDADRLAGIHDALGREFRRGDIVGRQDDHTLIVVLRGLSPQVANKRLTELLDRLNSVDVVDGVGIAMFPADGGSADELVAAAHAASLRARERGGPKVVDARWRPNGSEMLDVLLVESDPVLGRMLAAMIGTKGHAVELIESGDAAFERLAAHEAIRPRLLAVDLDTSGIDGLSLIRRLRRRGSLSSTSILLMTSRSSESDLRVALDLGVTDIIRKPFSGTLALHRIERLLGES